MGGYESAYLVSVLLGLTLWLIVFVLRSDLRKKMLFMSVGVSWLGITQLLYVQEYWTPQYLFPIPGIGVDLEDFLLCFVYGGLVSVLYEFLLRERSVCPVNESLIDSFRNIVLSVIPGVAIFIALETLTGLNSMHTTTIGLFVVGVVHAAMRPHLLGPMLMNGFVTGMLAVLILAATNATFPGYILSVWNQDALMGHFLLGVPIEEVFFHFALGLAFALFYEIQWHCRVMPLRARRK